MKNDSALENYRQLLQLAADTNKIYAVNPEQIPNVQCFNNSTLSLYDPPSHWLDHENHQKSDHDYDYSPWKFLGKIPNDVLDGEVSNDVAVKDNLVRVARLRGWKRHLQFGIVASTDSSVCRLDLGLGRGLTNWVTLY